MANHLYPATGHHIGTDYAAPEGTPVKSPAPARIVAHSKTGDLGHSLTIEYQYNGATYQFRFAHLSAFRRTIGEIDQGEVIAYTGNTGFSFGPHLHVDVWLGRVNLVGINAGNFRQRTVDPEVHYQT